jgi:hypothetical protein
MKVELNRPETRKTSTQTKRSLKIERSLGRQEDSLAWINVWTQVRKSRETGAMTSGEESIEQDKNERERYSEVSMDGGWGWDQPGSIRRLHVATLKL